MQSELKMKGICKSFSSVAANTNVDFSIKKGETHVLIGENGAGKTTLMNILYGLYRPDSGTISIDGTPVEITCPSDAIARGIGMVHQHFMLVESLTVAENVVLGSEPRKKHSLDMKKARETVAELCTRYGFALEADQRIEDLSVGKQQKVEILKLLYRGADILILDEPTAVLTPSEIDELGDIIHSLNKQGKSIILITHKLREVMSMSDRLTVLRRGVVTGNLRTVDATMDMLVEMMIGKNLALEVDVPPMQPGGVILDVIDLRARDARGHLAVDNLTFSVKEGEIVGLAGVDGNGQSEFLEALMGLRKVEGGHIVMTGRDITYASTRAIIDSGISSIAEDRHKRSVVLDMPLFENTLLGNFYRPPYGKGIWVDYCATRAATEEMIETYDVRAPSVDTQIMWLSGGNQQKYVVAREISRPHKLLVAAQPTRGIDIGAKRFIHERLLKEREAGKGVLLVSSELDEIIALSDRIIVMYKGRVAGEVRRAEADERSLGRMMIGKAEEDVDYEQK